MRDLGLLLGREHVDDAVDGLGRARGVQRAEHQVTGARPPSMARRMVSRSRISPTRMMSGSSRSAPRSAAANDSVCGADLAVVDQAALALVHELDRILDRDDVVLAVLVGVVDHRGQRGGLAGAGRPGDQHQALVQHRRTS